MLESIAKAIRLRANSHHPATPGTGPSCAPTRTPTLRRHIEEVIKSGPRTPDLGGTASTTQVGEAIAARVARH
ncbi:MAG TPA: hypothetical protein DEV74_02580 [Acidovorax sp.]|nr:hypothetical protein [Acidovorax sp.]